MTIVSIVSGTYNRLNHLQQMVGSIRRSVGVGFPYEIIIIDGGSTDGTIKWCEWQPDIHLIKHGELLGAVKAFNDGAYASQGDYVVLGNDDVIFIDESILCAVRFMQENPNVGVGCFYQDRYGRAWHVDEMPAIKNGKQASVYYGQVCIVPRWLGDKVGWWGTLTKTYGGDNELSCNVYEAGYKVEPISCACIHDLTPDDELRAVNSKLSGGVHPDSEAWARKWRRNTGFGAIIKENPMYPNPIKRQYRILYAPIYEQGHAVQKVQKRGLREALQRRGLTVEVDYMQDGIGKVFDAATSFLPDMIITQIQDAGTWKANNIKDLMYENPGVTLVNWEGDYHSENLYDDRYILLLKQFHITGLVTTAIKHKYDRAGIRWFYWQIGYEESSAVPDSTTNKHDIVFLGNQYSKERLSLGMALRRLPYNVGIYGSWSDSVIPNGYTLYDFDAGQKIYMNSLLAIGDSQWRNATGFVSNRLFQAMASGVCYLQQYVDGIEELLGLHNMQHYVLWDNLKDLEQKIEYFMNHPDEAKAIGEAGQKEIYESHSFDHRVDELFEKLSL